MTEQVCREGVGENGLNRLELGRIAEEGEKARVGGAEPGMVLGDAEDDDGDAAEEEKDGAETGRTEGEPRPYI